MKLIRLILFPLLLAVSGRADGVDYASLVKSLGAQTSLFPQWCEISGEFQETTYEKLKEGQLKTRIVFKVIFSQSNKGKVCFIASPYTISNSSLTKLTPKNITIQYDGEKWYTTYYPQESSATPSERPHCVISKEQPSLLGGVGQNYITAQAIFLNNLQILGDMNLMDIMKRFSPQEFLGQGINCDLSGDSFKIEIKRECEYYKASFTQRGGVFFPEYLIRTIGICTDRNKTISYQFSGKVPGLPGIDFPSKIRREYSINGAVDNSSITEVKSISFKDSVDETAFSPKVEDGWTVYDGIENISYKVGGVLQVLNPD